MVSPIASYTAAQIANMSREAIQALTRSDISALSAGQVAAFTTTGISISAPRNSRSFRRGR